MANLATRTEVKAALNITDTDSDNQIDALLAGYSALIEQEAGRKFSPQEFVEYHRGGEPTIALRQFPLASGSPVIQVTDITTGTVLTEDTDYTVDYDLGLLRRLPIGSQWTLISTGQVIYLQEDPPIARWKVTYTAATTPDDIKLALYLAIGSNLDRDASSSGGGGGIGGIIAESDGDYSYRRSSSAGASSTASSLSASGLPASAAAIARSYRTGVFA